MRRLSVTSLLAAALLYPGMTASAQTVGPASLRPCTFQLVAAAQFRPSADRPASPINLLGDDPYQHGTRREGVALMLVGAAGIITGLIVDEPIVTILSAGVGGLGLYLYVR